MDVAHYTIAIFPFLKTSSSVRIGGYNFRSTEDVCELPSAQAEAIRELARMLFVQDDLRVKSASYAVIPGLQVHSGDPRLVHLGRSRDVVAYFYAAPHEVFEDVFLSPEEISLVLFTPSRVSAFLTRPEHHTESIASTSGPTPDAGHFVPGYNGLYNLRHLFWVEPGSRVYGPKPRMTLNISQDLALDIEYRMAGLSHHHMLLSLLEQPETPTSLRVFSALHWFNAANENALSQSQALLNLAVAFETLLRLPESSKTDRLVDAISLLLGRTERLTEWAHQFYDARSRVAHEGDVRDRYFYPTGTKGQITGTFGSLLLYGRQIFQLCVNTLLVGIELAERADLREKFVSNNERYQKICEVLQDEIRNAGEKLLSLAPIIRALERYRFVDSVIDPRPQIAAVRLAALALLKCDLELSEPLKNAMARCGSVKRSDSEFEKLAGIEALHGLLKEQELATLLPETRTVRDLVDLIWMSLFTRYFVLKERNQDSSTP